MRTFIVVLLIIMSTPAWAQSTPKARFWDQWYGDRKTMADLLAAGYEVKSVVVESGVRNALDRDSSVLLFFLEKGASFYRCLESPIGSWLSKQSENTLNCLSLQQPKKMCCSY